MSELTVLDRMQRDSWKVSTTAVPEVVTRSVGALLALAVTVAHVADQGGVTLFASPDWLGWAYRLIEVGGVLTALALLSPRSARLGWAAGLVLGAAPFLGYVISRTIGIPGDSVDVGNWGDWGGTFALLVEAALFTFSAAMLLAPNQAASGAITDRLNDSADEAELTVTDTWSLWLPMNLK